MKKKEMKKMKKKNSKRKRKKKRGRRREEEENKYLSPFESTSRAELSCFVVLIVLLNPLGTAEAPLIICFTSKDL